MKETKKLPVQNINQFSEISNSIVHDKGVFIGLWKFKDINESILFTYRTAKYDYDETDINPPSKVRDSSDYYQRLIADDRTSKIVDFLIKELINSSSIITFPTSFIVSLPLTELSFDEFVNIENISENDSIESFGAAIRDNIIYIPLNSKILLVVDGQHRLAGLQILFYALKELFTNFEDSPIDLRKSIDSTIRKLKIENISDIEGTQFIEKIENFNLICTVLLGVDIYEQGKVFADVNFNQKPVNRSLYYDIYGSYPDVEKNDLFLLHNWCIRLNSEFNSSLKDKVKLLGTGMGYFSQAFFCDALLPFMRKNGLWYNIVSNYVVGNNKEVDLIYKFLLAYFNGISNKYKSNQDSQLYFWPSSNDTPNSIDSIILKTTGLGALIKLIPYFYNLVKNELNEDLHVLEYKIKAVFDQNLTFEKLNKRYENNEEKLLIIESKVNGEYYFSRTKGNFSKGAGKGLQNLLYDELLYDLGLKKNELKQLSFLDNEL